ncbi:hypothetical protein D3C84_1094450 [compost metagenome]
MQSLEQGLDLFGGKVGIKLSCAIFQCAWLVAGAAAIAFGPEQAQGLNDRFGCGGE